MNDEKKQELEELQEQLDEKKSELESLENNENEQEFDDYIDEVYGTFNVGVEFDASRVLKKLDPIAYNCGMNDYNDSRISELQEEIEELEKEIEEINNN